MGDILVLNESQLRACVTLDRALIDEISQAFACLAGEGVVMPPVLSMAMPALNAEVDIKTAYVPGLPGFAIKASPGFFNNPAAGLPSLGGFMVVLSAVTGQVQAVLLDNGYLTDLRTAAAGGVAARYLAPEQVPVAGIIGAGVQADLQARALMLERPVGEFRVWARDADKAAAFAEGAARRWGRPVSVCADRAVLVRESQVLLTTTASRQPLLEADWLHPGLHITAMGADAPDKTELAPAVAEAADVFVVDRLSQSLERGELRVPLVEQKRRLRQAPVELAELCRQARSGRPSPQAVTVADLTGTGIQDTAIANLALRIAAGRAIGTMIENR
ncbi:ornithine cyclodeaminase family protein [Granulosicoccaceae sp. 1_MG-2023]|nr:ornithine cyclodeaminase family protein [Granulosicoccaceae sp. 1_MG-2023]